MPSLSDIVANAVAQLHTSGNIASNQASSTVNGLKNTVSQQVNLAVSSGVGALSSHVTGALSTATGDVSKAVGQALQGNFTGAVTTLSNAPGDIVNAFLGGSSLKGPGASDPNNPQNNLAGALARSDPQLSYQWYCMLPTLQFPGTKQYDLPWYFVEEANTPLRNFELRTIFREGRDKHYVSKYTVDSLQLTIYADTTNVALKYLYAWVYGGNMSSSVITTSKNVAKVGGRFNTPNKYKKTIKVYFVDAAKQNLYLLEYIECFPQTIASFSMDSGSNRIVNHVTFSVGDVFYEVYDLKNTEAGKTLNSGSSNAIAGLLSTASNFVSSAAGSVSSLVSSASSGLSSPFK